MFVELNIHSNVTLNAPSLTTQRPLQATSTAVVQRTDDVEMDEADDDANFGGSDSEHVASPREAKITSDC